MVILQMFKDILKYLSTINTILLFLILAFFISPTSLRDVIDAFHPLIDQFHLSSHYWGQLYIVITIICIIPDILKNFYDDISDIILNLFQCLAKCQLYLPYLLFI